MALNDRARARLKEQKTHLGFSERDLAGMLGWSQARVAQKFCGRTPITLNELDAFCTVLNLSPTEVVRDPGLEFVADLTPTELRLLERVRQLPPVLRESVLNLLEIRVVVKFD